MSYDDYADKEILPTPPCFDKMGQPITVGCFIVYGTLLGRCAALKIGRVEKIRCVKSWSYRDEQFRISVRSVDDSWSHKKPEQSAKVGTCMFPERMLVLPETMIKSEYLELLGQNVGE